MNGRFLAAASLVAVALAIALALPAMSGTRAEEGPAASASAESVITEIEEADDWALASDPFDLPAPADLPPNLEAQASDEVKLDLAILKYARFARGGRLTPVRLSELLQQKPPVRDPKTVLSEIGAPNAPDAYLRGLHPKHVQFERMRQALLKARAR